MNDWPTEALLVIRLELMPDAPEQGSNKTLAEWVQDELENSFDDYAVSVQEVTI
jgi:hypothetical protein